MDTLLPEIQSQTITTYHSPGVATTNRCLFLIEKPDDILKICCVVFPLFLDTVP